MPIKKISSSARARRFLSQPSGAPRLRRFFLFTPQYYDAPATPLSSLIIPGRKARKGACLLAIVMLTQSRFLDLHRHFVDTLMALPSRLPKTIRVRLPGIHF